MDPIEAMARAACRKHRQAVHGEDADDKVVNLAWEKHVPEQEAALQALKENISDEMKMAGGESIDRADDNMLHNMTLTLSIYTFQAMIDAALTPDKEKTDV